MSKLHPHNHKSEPQRQLTGAGVGEVCFPAVVLEAVESTDMLRVWIERQLEKSKNPLRSEVTLRSNSILVDWYRLFFQVVLVLRRAQPRR